MLFPVSQFQTSIWDADCSLSGGIGLLFLRWSSGDIWRQHISLALRQSKLDLL